MSEHTALKLLSACGYSQYVEAPLLAERVAIKSAELLNELETQLQQEREASARKNQALNDLTTERNLLARDIKLEREANARLRESNRNRLEIFKRFLRKTKQVRLDLLALEGKNRRLRYIGMRILAAHKQSSVDWPAMRELEAALAAKGEG